MSLKRKLKQVNYKMRSVFTDINTMRKKSYTEVAVQTYPLLSDSESEFHNGKFKVSLLFENHFKITIKNKLVGLEGVG